MENKNILEMFENNNNIPIKDIINLNILSNYSDNFKNNIINSLVISNILLLDNNKLILNDNSNFDSNIIDIFFNQSDYLTIIEKNRYDELIHSREEITYTHINKALKNNKMSYEKLFNTILKSIKVFLLDADIFDKSLKYMIENDYIKYISDEYEKIDY